MYTLRFFYICIGLFVSTHINAVMHIEQTQDDKDTTLVLYEDNIKIGFLSYRKIPLVPFYIAHSLYVYPEYRHKGYAKKFLLYLNETLKEKGATRIYIQPGPFELVNGYTTKVKKNIYYLRMKQLIDLYKTAGFKRVNVLLSKCVSLVYPCIGIDEDARYLMVKIIEK